MSISQRQNVDSASAAAKRFAMGVTAAVAGVAAVYPFDTLKTKLQNERKLKNVAAAAARPPLYDGMMDCAKYVMKHEGVRGFYRGLGAQATGKGIEKGFQLFIVDVLRQKIMGKSKEHSIATELFAGSIAGAIQVLTTNPFELVKVRIQTSSKSSIEVLRDVGVAGLFRGLSACLVRDVAFAAAYFAIYAEYKHRMFGSTDVANAAMSLPQLFIGGSVAGCLSAWMTTPADVIKTRLQAESRKGDPAYTGFMQCARSIAKEEGGVAFFKGAVPRMLRSSPQYGVMLLTYDWLQHTFR
jgi:solute carrier family 25 aspartate/glutamate transporter 12/13